MSKYYSQKEIVDGITFHSKKEARRYRELKLMERAGVIKELQLQVPYTLIPKSSHGRAIKYIADFVYFEDGKRVVEDTKGFRTKEYKLKKRMMAEMGIDIRET